MPLLAVVILAAGMQPTSAIPEPIAPPASVPDLPPKSEPAETPLEKTPQTPQAVPPPAPKREPVESAPRAPCATDGSSRSLEPQSPPQSPAHSSTGGAPLFPFNGSEPPGMHPQTPVTTGRRSALMLRVRHPFQHIEKDAQREKQLVSEYSAEKERHGANSPEAYLKLIYLINYYVETKQTAAIEELSSESSLVFAKLAASDQQDFAAIILAMATDLARTGHLKASQSLYLPIIEAAHHADWSNGQALAAELASLASQPAVNQPQDQETLLEAADRLFEKAPSSAQQPASLAQRRDLKMKLAAVHLKLGKNQVAAQEVEELLKEQDTLPAQTVVLLLKELVSAYVAADDRAKLVALAPRIQREIQLLSTDSKQRGTLDYPSWNAITEIVLKYTSADQFELAKSQFDEILNSTFVTKPESSYQATNFVNRAAHSLSAKGKRALGADLERQWSELVASRFGKFSKEELAALSNQGNWLRQNQMTLESEKLLEEFQNSHKPAQTSDERLAQLTFLQGYSYQDRDRVLALTGQVLKDTPEDTENLKPIVLAAQIYEKGADKERASQLQKQALKIIARALPKDEDLAARYLPKLAEAPRFQLEHLIRQLNLNYFDSKNSAAGMPPNEIPAQMRTFPRTLINRLFGGLLRNGAESMPIVIAQILVQDGDPADAKQLLESYMSRLASENDDSRHLTLAIVSYARMFGNSEPSSNDQPTGRAHITARLIPGMPGLARLQITPATPARPPQNTPASFRPAIEIVLQSAFKTNNQTDQGKKKHSRPRKSTEAKFSLDKKGVSDVELINSCGDKQRDAEVLELLRSCQSLSNIWSFPGKADFKATFDYKSSAVNVN